MSTVLKWKEATLSQTKITKSTARIRFRPVIKIWLAAKESYNILIEGSIKIPFRAHALPPRATHVSTNLCAL